MFHVVHEGEDNDRERVVWLSKTSHCDIKKYLTSMEYKKIRKAISRWVLAPWVHNFLPSQGIGAVLHQENNGLLMSDTEKKCA